MQDAQFKPRSANPGAAQGMPSSPPVLADAGRSLDDVFGDALQTGDFLNCPTFKNDSLIRLFRIAGVFGDDSIQVSVEFHHEFIGLGINATGNFW
jgi:hypothetical protein